MPVALGFVLPAAVLGSYAVIHFEAAANAEVYRYAGNSVLLSAPDRNSCRRHRHFHGLRRAPQE